MLARLPPRAASTHRPTAEPIGTRADRSTCRRSLRRRFSDRLQVPSWQFRGLRGHIVKLEDDRATNTFFDRFKTLAMKPRMALTLIPRISSNETAGERLSTKAADAAELSAHVFLTPVEPIAQTSVWPKAEPPLVEPTAEPTAEPTTVPTVPKVGSTEELTARPTAAAEEPLSTEAADAEEAYTC